MVQLWLKCGGKGPQMWRASFRPRFSRNSGNTEKHGKSLFPKHVASLFAIGAKSARGRRFGRRDSRPCRLGRLPFDAATGHFGRPLRTTGTDRRCRREWQGQQGLNPRPTVLETVALPTELYPFTSDAPDTATPAKVQARFRPVTPENSARRVRRPAAPRSRGFARCPCRRAARSRCRRGGPRRRGSPRYGRRAPGPAREAGARWPRR